LGHVQKTLGINEWGVIDSSLPKALPLTLFAEWKETSVWIVFFALLVVNARRFRNLRPKN
jgi:hypothetical protein